MPKYLDIHSHINFKVYNEDRDVVIKRALDNDTWVINIGTQYDTSKKAVKMTEEYPEGIYATIGLHPIHTDVSHHDVQEFGNEGKEFTSRGEIFDKGKYRELAQNKKVIGIGECGLDYYRMDENSIEKQKIAFISQIELANELNLPLMLHIRNNIKHKEYNAYFDVYELLKKHAKVKGVSHFFAGSVEDMKRLVELGLYISFAGPITFPLKPEICDYEEVIRQTPLDKIMADTDSPYVSPKPFRGERNEPIHVSQIVKKIAEIKGLPEIEVAEAIILNVRNLFDI